MGAPPAFAGDRPSGVRVSVATSRQREIGYGGLEIVSEDVFALSIDSPSAVEGQTGNADLAFRATLSKPATFAVPVAYRTVGEEGTATAGADYEEIADGGLAFAPGETEREIAVAVVGDSDREPDETVTVRVSVGQEFLSSDKSSLVASGGREATGTGTIRNDDLHEISFGDSLDGYENHAADGNLPVRFKVLLAPPATVPVTVRYVTATVDRSSYPDGLSYATSGDDYEPTSGTLTFAPGETEKTVEVPVIDDDVVERGQYVGLLLWQALADPPEVGIDIVRSAARALIHSEDQSTLSIDSPSVYEGSSGTRDLVFTVRLSNPVDLSAGTVRLPYALGGTANAGTDYETPGGAVAFGRDETEKALAIRVLGDRAIETDETIEITFDRANQHLSGTKTVTGTGTILNDDHELSVVEPETAVEPPDGRTGVLGFAVNLHPAASGDPVTVDYATLGDTATDDVDYAAKSGTLTFESGETRKTVDIAVNGDSDVEDEYERMYLVLSNARGPSGGTVTMRGGKSRFVGRIRDTLTLSIDSPSALESAGDLTFTVTIDKELGEEVDIGYAVGGGTAGRNDYRDIRSGTIRLAAGETRKTLVATLVDDDDIEPDETLKVSLDAPPMFHPSGAERFTVTGVGTIVNQDHELNFHRPGPRVQEGASGTTTTLAFPVFLHPPVTTGDVTVVYRSVDSGSSSGRATSRESDMSVGYDDYEATSGTLTFPASVTRQEFAVTVNGDGFSEETEKVVVELDSAAGPPGVDVRIGKRWISGDHRVSGWIENDDAFAYSPVDNSQTVQEGGSDERVGVVVQNYAHFRFRSNRQHYGQEGSCHGRGGTAVGGDDRRNAAADYAAAQGNDYLSWVTPREVLGDMGVATCFVNVFGDDRVEEDDTVEVYYQNPDVGIGPSNAIHMGTLTIRNDDHALSVDAPGVNEGDEGETGLTFTVTLDPPVSEAVTVDYAVGDGSATAAGASGAAGGHDFVPVAPGTLTFEAGETEKTIEVAVRGDETDEPDETVLLTLSNPAGGPDFLANTYPGSAVAGTVRNVSTILTPADPVAGPIRNDDPTPTLSVAAPESAVTEGGTLAFPLTLSNPGSEDIAVHYALTGSATAGADYEGAASGSVTFAPGERGSSKSIALTTLDDMADELDETVEVTLSLPDPDPGRVVLGTASATGTILDDDLQSVTVAPVAATIAEGAVAAFDVKRAGVSEEALTVSFTIGDEDGVLAPMDAPPGSAVFASDGDTVRVTLATDDDNVDEPDAALTLTLADGDDHDLGTPSAAAVTVQDNDAAPSVSIDDAPEALEGATLAFPVELSHPSATQVAVAYSLGGTATAGADYTDGGAGSVTFAALETATSIALVTTDDTVYEPDDETVTVTLADGDAHDLGESFRGTGTILDNDGPPLASIDDTGSVTEGGTLAFRVKLGRPSALETTVTYSLGGTATAGVDYTDGSGGSVTFAAGSEQETISLTTLDDKADEVDETVEVTLADGDAHDLGAPSQATGTILDDDLPAVTIAANARFVAGTLPAAFTLTRQSVDIGASLDVDVAVVDPGGVLDGDAPSTVAFEAGKNEHVLRLATRSTPVGGVVTVTLQEGQGYDLAEPSSAFVHVLEKNADPVSVFFGTPPGTVDEGETLEFTVWLGKPSHRELRIGYGLSGSATQGKDYTDLTGSPLVFPPGEGASGAGKTISLRTVVDGMLDEGEESVTVTLEGPGFQDEQATTLGYRIVVREETGSIRNKVQDVTVAEETAIIGEGDDAVFVLTRTGDLSETLDVTFDVAGGDAVLAGAAPTAATFGANAGTVGVTLATEDDRTDEPDAALTLTLTESHRYFLSASRQATVTVQDNDGTPTVSISDDAPTVEEGERLAFPVELSHPSAAGIAVTYALAGSATAGSDYTDSGTGTVTFAPGEVAKSVALETIDDAVDEPDEETVEVTLGTPTTGAATLGMSTATGKIEDNEDAPTVSIAAPPAPVSEQMLRLVFPVELSGASWREVAVPYSLGGTATQDEDYEDITDPDDTQTGGGTVTFAPGETAKRVTFETIDDTVDEPDEETVAVTLGAPTTDAATLGTSTATGRIADDDPPPVVSIGGWSAEVDEGQTSVFTVSLDSGEFPDGDGAVRPGRHGGCVGLHGLGRSRGDVREGRDGCGRRHAELRAGRPLACDLSGDNRGRHGRTGRDGLADAVGASGRRGDAGRSFDGHRQDRRHRFAADGVGRAAARGGDRGWWEPEVCGDAERREFASGDGVVRAGRHGDGGRGLRGQHGFRGCG